MDRVPHTPTPFHFRCEVTLGLILGVLTGWCIPGWLQGQQADAVSLLEMVHRLPSTPRALVITARPEQEPAGLVAWLHLGAGAEVGVLSLTRGEAAANRFGREIGEALGVLRVQELQQVRARTGGRQFYTRAYDIGATGSVAEVWERWPRQAMLGDIVATIRSLRPHILIVGCPTADAVGDPQGTAARELAEEAFTAAADTSVVSIEAGAFRPAWQPTHLYQAGCGGPDAVTIDLGQIHAPRAASYAAIGTGAMTWQRTQGLGATPAPARAAIQLELIRTLQVAAAERPGVFHGIPTNWRQRALDPTLSAPRQERFQALADALDAVRDSFDVRAPSQALAAVLNAVGAVRRARELIVPSTIRSLPWREDEADDDAALELTESRLVALALAASGLVAEFTADQAWVAQEDSVVATLTLANRGALPATLIGGAVEFGRVRRLPSTEVPRVIAPGASQTWSIPLRPLDATVPWWLALRREGAAYSYPPGRAARAEQLTGEGSSRHGRAVLQVVIDGVALPLSTEPLGATRLDPDRGAVREPVQVMPPITVLLERMLDYLPADVFSGRRLRVEVRSWTTRPREVEVRVEAPDGVTVANSPQRVTLAPGQTAEVEFTLGARVPRDRHALRVFAESEGETFVQGVIPIRHPHIEPVVVQRPSGLWLDAVPVAVPASVEIGSLVGERDFNSIALRQLLLRVTDLSPAGLDSARLTGLRYLVIGPGALTVAESRRAVPALLDWVGRGGRLVVHDPSLELLGSGLLPWPIRLTEPPRPLSGTGIPLTPAPAAGRWWRTPHRLDDLDLDDWHNPVATVLAGEFDPRYVPIILGHAAPDAPGIPVGWSTRIGRGTVVYTTLELPTQVLAGEGGALRLLLNLLLAPDGG